LKSILYALCLTISLCLPSLAKGPVRTIDGIVTKVFDGDTLNVMDSRGRTVKVHLYGVDAPETEKLNRTGGRTNRSGQPYGDESGKVLAAKIYQKRVKVEVMDVDHNSRSISVVWLDGRNINREMVAEGYVWAYREYLDQSHSAEYIQAEEQARSRKLGLWQQIDPVPPWEFRKQFKKRIILKALSFKWFE